MIESRDCISFARGIVGHVPAQKSLSVTGESRLRDLPESMLIGPALIANETLYRKYIWDEKSLSSSLYCRTSFMINSSSVFLF